MALIDTGLELLEEEECWRLLGTGVIGRIGVSVGALPAIFPVNYSLVDHTIAFCTAPGTKLTAALAHAVVAFEVDAYDPATGEGWSVLSIGRAEEVRDAALFATVVEQHGEPWASDDRSHVVRIQPTFISGRRVVMPVPRVKRTEGD